MIETKTMPRLQCHFVRSDNKIHIETRFAEVELHDNKPVGPRLTMHCQASSHRQPGPI
jgi:hypothetical protein